MSKFSLVINLIIPCLVFLSSDSYALINGVDVLKSDPLSRAAIALQMVEKLDSGEVNFYKGSGVLIRQDVILTAGHNFFYLADPTASEAIFAVQPEWGVQAHGQKRIQVKKAIVYPEFSQSPLGTRNDLALVFLREPAPINYKPIEVEMDGSCPPGLSNEGILLGYGRSTANPNVPPSDYRLRRLDLKFARWENSSIFDSQKIWFSNQNGSIAAGDSGGPALLKCSSGPYKVYGIGIHQRYDECVKEKRCAAESAYSNTTYFAAWIKASLQAGQ